MDDKLKEQVLEQLKHGKSENEIKMQFFDEKQREIFEEFDTRSETPYQVALSKLREVGVVLDADSGKNWGYGKQYWKAKLSNTTVSVYLPLNHHYASLQLFEETSFGRYLMHIIPDGIVDVIKEADEIYPSLLKEWAEIERECVKYRMVKDLSEESIVAIVKEKLRGTGLEYNLSMEETFVLLKVRMKRGRFFELRIPHDKFLAILTDGLVSDIRTVARTSDGIKCDFRIGRYGNNVNWQTSE